MATQVGASLEHLDPRALASCVRDLNTQLAKSLGERNGAMDVASTLRIRNAQLQERTRELDAKLRTLQQSAMSDERARAELASAIMPDNALSLMAPFISWIPGLLVAQLEGSYTPEQLEAIAHWMRAISAIQESPQAGPDELVAG